EVAGVDREVLDEVAYLEHRRGGRPGHDGSIASSVSAKWQAEHWAVPSTGRSSGVSSRHIGWAKRQRGWKAQPGGGGSIDGGLPVIGTSRSRPWSSSRGSEASSPSV